MRTWRKMVISWDFRIPSGLKTNVMRRCSDGVDRPISISSMQATALPENKGKLIIDIGLADGPIGKRRGDPMLAKLNRFNREAKQFELHVNLKAGPWIGKDKPYSSLYFLEFEFEDVENFPDTVLKIVKELWRLLEIKDENSHHLGDFKLEETTRVEIEPENWISLARWWKIYNLIPHITVKDLYPRR